MSFVHLHVHSNYSLLSGSSTIEDLVNGAAALGMESLALTDTNGMYATVPFIQACQKAGIKPIPGAEIACPEGSTAEKAVLLPRNRAGYSEICRLVTARHLDADFSLLEALEGVSENVFVLTRCENQLKRLSGRKHVYVALPSGVGHQGRQQRYYCRSLADRCGLRTVATNDVHFLKPDGHFIHRVLSAVRTGTTVGTLPEGAVAPPECYLKSAAEMRDVFRDFPESLRAAAEIAWACDVNLELGRSRPPRFPLPQGESAYSYLTALAFEGLRRRCGPFTREAHETLARELDVIERLKMASYFLVCWDIVRFAREKGVPSLGRGSAANSLVSYCLWITHVNPLEHNLFFERFLNLERGTPPDFDLDFGTEDREIVLDYLFEKYGRDHTAMVSTISTLRARSAVREVAKALGIPESEFGTVVKRIPHFSSAANLEEKLQQNPETRNLPVEDEPFNTILDVARRIAEFPRHVATHPCGIVISPEPITDFMPLQMGEKGLEVTQWTMYPVEDAGLIKIDILGQKGLAVISDTIRAVERNYGVSVNPESIDYLSDKKGKALMREGKTEGCFYIESPIMQQLFRQAKCDDFEVLTALSSIIRPGVSNYGGKQLYLKRYLGEEPVRYPHPSLEEVLEETFGCLIYQEQVIQVAVSMAGMTLAEADGLRVCMSKKRNWHKMESYKERFFQGAREKGIPEPVIEEVFSQIESFAGYAFCKAHSASFALESFESLYWRAHYPAEFMAAVLSNQGGYYSTMEYVEEARRMGLVILPPCVNKSDVAYTGKGRELRVGLMQVKGLRREVMEQIVSKRDAGGEYRSVENFLDRVAVTKREAEMLAKCGAMDTLGGRRPEILWQVAVTLERGDTTSEGLSTRRAVVEALPVLDDLTFEERMAYELECLDVCVSAHPFALFRSQIDRARRLRPIVDSTDVGSCDGQVIYCLGWEVTMKRVRTEKDGRVMAFVTFSDERGRIETTFFPDSYERCAEELFKGAGPFLLLGKVEVSMRVPNLLVERVALIR
ncbi:MAG: DNA polymerase III subunit alpha [Candidatus Latescibacteria bacterium]|nr:DNA polymerase III subunit alpha [Candidatus Latescibacterota bacterium]NIM21393.1 DNA polymerase III subunit alpha [Candidatus Latescibacterota bacterium]NIM65574.1 DNA polymerase III subunit alpha [Candidatus Latescibacterota bacterium]NIO01954.1 DNA polymerase III subunit alpha [Candidatus Latescibacterota bacterium]NIO28767.1 DNA polymerase III subunit alpha [Candidatus Latescibacterota bacterium]